MTEINRYSMRSFADNRLSVDYNDHTFFSLALHTGFLWNNALNLALLSGLVYQEREVVETFFSDAKLKIGRSFSRDRFIMHNPFLVPLRTTEKIGESVSFVDKSGKYNVPNKLLSTNTQLALFADSQNIFCVVRGTEDIRSLDGARDWLTNLTAYQTDFKVGTGQVHLGFYEAFLSIKDDFTRYCEAHAGKNIIVTGHSLGGAVATLIAAYARETINEDVMLYTFGSPRAADLNFVRYYSTTKKIHAWRLFHVGDIVPLMPPKHINLRLPMFSLVGHGIPGIVLLAASNADYDLSPFTHFGIPIALKKTHLGTCLPVIGPRATMPIEIDTDRRYNWMNPQLVDLEPQHGIDIVKNHAMPMYTRLIASCLRQCARDYTQTDGFAGQNHVDFLDRQSRALEDLIYKEISFDGIMPASTVATTAGGDQLGSDEKYRACKLALDAVKEQKLRYQEFLSGARTPQDCAARISSAPLDGNLHREICYHAKLPPNGLAQQKATTCNDKVPYHLQDEKLPDVDFAAAVKTGL